MTRGRISDVQNFYGLLDSLAERVGGPRTLAACSGRLGWPRRGVYFFMEDGEIRSDSGTGPRIVRVGTHALTEGSGTKLWSRLSQHRGQQKTGGGNHRGSKRWVEFFQIHPFLVKNRMLLSSRYPEYGQARE